MTIRITVSEDIVSEYIFRDMDELIMFIQTHDGCIDEKALYEALREDGTLTYRDSDLTMWATDNEARHTADLANLIEELREVDG